MTARRESLTLTAVGILVLLIGSLVYLLDRDPALVPFFASASLYGSLPPVFGAAGTVLPAFAHAFAFSLLTAACVARTRANALIACVSWLIVGIAFEWLQQPAIAGRLADAAGPGAERHAVLDSLVRYASNGTFDPLDVLSTAAGAVLALVVILLVTEHRHDES